MSYVFGSCFVVLLSVMALIRAIKGDKAVFTKKLLRLRRYIYG